ncbi:MAG: CPBP family intramembrane metalloprotease [Clostridia bacterium]|nr:CPBP family intramembrane metalloprotease [Clostridia bacterium]
MKQETPSIKSLRNFNLQQSAGFTFSASTILMVLVSIVFVIILGACGVVINPDDRPDWYLYVSFLLPQLVFVIVTLVMIFVAKTPIKEVTGKPHWKYFLIALVLQFGLISLSELNALFVDWLQTLGLEVPPVSIPSTQGWGIVGVMAVVAFLPAVLEEVIFRGFVLRGLKDFGLAASVLLCGALFSIYHQNPAQTIYQFCCGACFALIAFRSGSVFPTMVAHFINNAVIVLYYHFTGNETMPVPWPVTVIAAVCLALSVGYLIFLDKKKPSADIAQSQEPPQKDVKGFWLAAALGIVVCVVNWVSALL